MQVCQSCKRLYPDTDVRWRCACGGALDHRWDDGQVPRFDPGAIAAGPATVFRYRAALPLPAGAEPVTLGEGMTPLLVQRWHGLPVHFKLDFLNPTGSFKDRGAAVLMSMLKAAGVKAVFEDSSGNAGASLAAYAAAAGIPCRIFVPATASPGKLVQIAAYGADVVRVPGTRADAAAAALAAADAGTAFYASHNWVPWFVAGMRTAAFELWEQLGWQVPDVVVTPVGYGSYLLGLYRGFQELRQAGMTDRLPRLIAVQAVGCAPLAAALAAGLAAVPAVSAGDTIAEGIRCQQPVRGAALLEALRATGGTAITVGEDDIAAGVRDLARRGLYVEPSAAVVAPALAQLAAAGALAATDTVVAILTGSGLKSAGTALYNNGTA